MQNNFIQANKKIFELIITLVVIVIVVFLIIKSFKHTETDEYILQPEEAPVSQVQLKFKNMTDVIQSKDFQNLVKFGDWPLSVEEKGRANPFISF